MPFNISYFPVVRTTDPKIAPGAVGVAFVTGDRNNPLDYFVDPDTSLANTLWTTPAHHRLNVVFDRQDYNTTITASQMGDATSMNTNTSASEYYLKTNYGYYINFPAPTTNSSPPPPSFIAKGIVSPIVVNGVLFYSYFTPTLATCTGGGGTTSTFRVMNIMKPTVNTGDATSSNPNGRVLSWTGVASNLTIRSVLAGVQAGLTSGSGTTNNTSQAQNLKLQDLLTLGAESYSKIRVWRTVH